MRESSSMKKQPLARASSFWLLACFLCYEPSPFSYQETLSLVLGRWEIRPFGQGKQNDLRAFFLNLACVGSVVSDRWPVAGVGSDELLGPGTGETSCHRGVASQASSQLSKADAPPGGAHTTNGRGNGSHRTQPLLKEVGALPRSVPCVS